MREQKIGLINRNFEGQDITKVRNYTEGDVQGKRASETRVWCCKKKKRIA